MMNFWARDILPLLLGGLKAMGTSEDRGKKMEPVSIGTANGTICTYEVSCKLIPCDKLKTWLNVADLSGIKTKELWMLWTVSHASVAALKQQTWRNVQCN